MPFTDTAKNLMLNALGGVAGYVSLHTANPGAAGTSEIAGGAPAYARRAVTWNAAASANLDSSNQPVFDVPAGVTVTHYGLWSTAVGGVFYGGDPLSAPEAYGAQGTYTLTDLDLSLINPS
jgi:hypothetical protein